MSAADQLATFYPDLAEPRLARLVRDLPPALLDQHPPTWERAQPFRFLCHNGEINTIDGNVNLMRARGRAAGRRPGPSSATTASACCEPLHRRRSPRTPRKLDAALELLVHGGARPQPRHGDARAAGVGGRARHPPRRARLLPLPRRPDRALGRAGRPGVHRRAARRARRWTATGCGRCATRVCEDGTWSCASEVGAVRTAGHGSVRRGRLGPGEMLLVDPALEQPLLENAELKRRLAARQPYGEWVRTHQRPRPPGQPVDGAGEDLVAAPGRRRLHQGGGDHRPAADGQRRQGADLLDGRRHRAGGAVGPPAAPSTTTSSSASRRSPTRRSTTCASGRS